MNSIFFFRRPPGFCLLLALLSTLTVGARADETKIMASVEDRVVTAATSATVWVNLLNTSSAPITATFQNSYVCILHVGAESRPARLAVVDGNAPLSE